MRNGRVFVCCAGWQTSRWWFGDEWRGVFVVESKVEGRRGQRTAADRFRLRKTEKRVRVDCRVFARQLTNECDHSHSHSHVHLRLQLHLRVRRQPVRTSNASRVLRSSKNILSPSESRSPNLRRIDYFLQFFETCKTYYYEATILIVDCNTVKNWCCAKVILRGYSFVLRPATAHSTRKYADNYR